MRIIKLGTLPKLESEKSYVAVCAYCKTMIEFQHREGEYLYEPDCGRYLIIACPLCNRNIHKNIK